MANTGPVTPQVTTTHNPPAPPPLPGAKPSSVPKAQSVALTPSTQVDRSTQFPSVAPRLQLSDRVKQGISALEPHKHVKFADEVEVIPPKETPAETTPAEKPADDKTAEKSEKKEEPITVVHKRSLGERLIDGVKNVILFIPRIVYKFTIKPIYDYAIKPVYEFALSKVQPAKYESIKLEQKAAAEKAELDQKQANRQAFEKACLDVAMQRYTDVHKQLQCAKLAKLYGVTEREALNEIISHEARVEANHLFQKQLETGKLELNALSVNPETGKPDLNLLRVDSETGKKYYATRTFTPATEKTRAAVVVTEKNPEGKDVERLLDADSAEVAKRLGNDPAMATALNDYNKAREEYGQKLAAFKVEDAKYQKAKEKAEKKGKTLEKEAPVHPGEPPKRPVLKCTDEKVLEAIKLESKQYREELQTKVQSLATDIERLMAEFAQAYPGVKTTNYIQMARDLQEHKARVEAAVETFETRLNERKKDLEQAKERGDVALAALTSAETKRLEMDIDFNQRYLAIDAKECELMSVQAELEELNRMNPDIEEQRTQDFDDWKNGALVLDPEHPDYYKRVSGTRDRLEIERLKDWVYKNAKGNVLDIFTRDASGTVTGVDKDKYAQVNDIVIPAPDNRQNPAPAYKGVDMPGPDYRDQQGTEWSQVEPIKRYVVLKDENGNIIKNSDGSEQVELVTVGAHWAARDSNVIGQHKKVAVFGNQIPRGTPEVFVVSETEVLARGSEVTAKKAWIDEVDQEVKQAVTKMKAVIGEQRYALTEENLDAYNKQRAAEKSRQEPRAASVTGAPLIADDNSETGDDEAVMVRNLFDLAENRPREKRQFQADSEHFHMQIERMNNATRQAARPDADEDDHDSLVSELFSDSVERERYREGRRVVAERMAVIAERDYRGDRTARSDYDAPHVTS